MSAPENPPTEVPPSPQQQLWPLVIRLELEFPYLFKQHLTWTNGGPPSRPTYEQCLIFLNISGTAVHSMFWELVNSGLLDPTPDLRTYDNRQEFRRFIQQLWDANYPPMVRTFIGCTRPVEEPAQVLGYVVGTLCHTYRVTSKKLLVKVWYTRKNPPMATAVDAAPGSSYCVAPRSPESNDQSLSLREGSSSCVGLRCPESNDQSLPLREGSSGCVALRSPESNDQSLPLREGSSGCVAPRSPESNDQSLRLREGSSGCVAPRSPEFNDQSLPLPEGSSYCVAPRSPESNDQSLPLRAMDGLIQILKTDENARRVCRRVFGIPDPNLEGRVSDLKESVSGVKEGVSGLQEGVSGLQERSPGCQQWANTVSKDIAQVQPGMAQLLGTTTAEEDVTHAHPHANLDPLLEQLLGQTDCD